MKRSIIKIDADKCNGCGLCVNACHEGALQLVNGKAVLISENYCDGLGACLPECPTGAITIEKREAAPFDEVATQKHLEQKAQPEPLACGCAGMHAKHIERPASAPISTPIASSAVSELRQWPVQIQLVPAGARYFDNAHLLIAADCTAYAHPNIHSYMKNKITLIGCPKLDHTDYANKLTEILTLHDIQSVTVLRMEVPCCGGIVQSVKQALQNSGKMIPWRVIVIGTDGHIVED